MSDYRTPLGETEHTERRSSWMWGGILVVELIVCAVLWLLGLFDGNHVLIVLGISLPAFVAGAWIGASAFDSKYRCLD